MKIKIRDDVDLEFFESKITRAVLSGIGVKSRTTKMESKMIAVRFGKWNHAAGRFWVWDRILWKGYKWTPFCRVKKRY